MSSTQFNKGPSYGLSAEVKNRLLSKYDPQKEAELRTWIEGLTGLSIGPDFQKGLKDGTILCTLMNKLQPGSVPKINRSMQNWHQLENLSNFIKAMVSYGMNPVDLFEANDLFESGNMTQVQVSLLALAGKMGTNKCASQSGMTAYGTRRHLYDPKNHILPPMDHSTISLQMGTNKCASQVGLVRVPQTPLPLGTTSVTPPPCPCRMGYTQGANQKSARSFGRPDQIYCPSIATQGHVARMAAPSAPGDCPTKGSSLKYPLITNQEEAAT
uniref:Calponin-2 n=1 Tax=Cercocebus atys TaxID=9531 RepID=A0A2K5MYI5_CERAT